MATPGPERMVTDNDIIRLMQTADDPFTTAPEIADRAGVARQTIYKHLQRLHGEGEIKKKKIGSSAAIWWVEEREP